MIKNYFKKAIALATITMSMVALNPMGASAEWRKDNKGSWYSEGNSWATGWRNIDGKWYYFNDKGYMEKNVRIDGYELGEDGAWILSSATYPSEKNKFIKTLRQNKEDTWYKIDLKEGEGLTAVLHPQIDKNSMNIYICDESGSELASDYSVSDGGYSVVSYKAASEKTIYVKVTGEAGIYYIGFYDQYFNNASSLNDERDFFGSLWTAKKVVNGMMTKKDEKLDDWYRVDVKEGKTLTVNITPEIDKNYIKLGIYDKEHSELVSTYSLGNEQTGTVSKIAPTNTTYFIKVSGSTGKYDLDVSIE